MRAVASRLGVTPAALYRLVDSAPDLVQIVVESIVEEAASGVKVSRKWRPALLQLARVIRGALLQHPMLVEAYQRNLVASPSGARAIDAVLESLLRAGLSSTEVVDVYAAVHAFAVGYTAFEHRRGALTGDPYGGNADASGAAAEVRARFADRYYAPAGFETGLAFLLDGVEARVAARAKRR